MAGWALPVLSTTIRSVDVTNVGVTEAEKRLAKQIVTF
jgi:hypothetical protein